jgi:hypothetical protein
VETEAFLEAGVTTIVEDLLSPTVDQERFAATTGE